MKKRHLLALTLIPALLVACGGSDDSFDDRADIADPKVRFVHAVPGAPNVTLQRNGVAELQLDDLGRVPDLVTLLAAAGVRLTRVDPRIPTLEDLYFAVRDGRAAFAEGNTLGGSDLAARFDRKRTAPSLNDLTEVDP